jgi:hypothetical protein
MTATQKRGGRYESGSALKMVRLSKHRPGKMDVHIDTLSPWFLSLPRIEGCKISLPLVGRNYRSGCCTSWNHS